MPKGNENMNLECYFIKWEHKFSESGTFRRSKNTKRGCVSVCLCCGVVFLPFWSHVRVRCWSSGWHLNKKRRYVAPLIPQHAWINWLKQRLYRLLGGCLVFLLNFSRRLIGCLTYAWSIKYRLITKLIVQLVTNLRDESFKPN